MTIIAGNNGVALKGLLMTNGKGRGVKTPALIICRWMKNQTSKRRSMINDHARRRAVLHGDFLPDELFDEDFFPFHFLDP
ncbi:MAG TPA: hypothetical protein PLP16_12565, partial [Smithellaceae bacterium]|nr:hypothetical protein [Smithellaceae bacterium]